MKILLAIDDSKFSEAVVRAVAQQIRPDQAQLFLFHVCEPIYLSEPAYSYAIRAQDVEAARHKLIKESKDLLARAETLLTGAGFKVETAVGEGDPRIAILEFASTCKADLIMLGSHGRRGLERFAMGSVAEAVARHAPCSVEIVRHRS